MNENTTATDCPITRHETGTTCPYQPDSTYCTTAPCNNNRRRDRATIVVQLPTPQKHTQGLDSVLHILSKERRYATWPHPSMTTKCCTKKAIFTNVVTPDGTAASISVTQDSILKCPKCGIVIDPHPLLSLRQGPDAPTAPQAAAQLQQQPQPQQPPPPPANPAPGLHLNPMNWTAVVDKVLDGDTLDVTVDLGFETTTNARLRIANVDAYEKGTPQGDAARTDITAKLAGRTISLITYRDRDKYGRHLATVRMPSGKDLAEYIREHNWNKTP